MKMRIILSLIISALIFTACEDTAPFEYKEDHYVEAYLQVGEPINNIKVTRTVPLNEPYSLEEAIIKDAEVTVSKDDEVFNLEYRSEPEPGYYYDENYKVEPKTNYDLRIELQDGSVYSARTLTPDTFNFRNEPEDHLYFPPDPEKYDSISTLPSPPDSTKLFWTKSGNINFYIVSVTCLDTLNYGQYLPEPEEEENARTYRPWDGRDNYYKELTTTNLLAGTSTPIVWFAFKWHGKHRVKITAPDNNLLKWTLQYAGFDGEVYNPNLNTIKGGAFGVFGSSAEIEYEMFLFKHEDGLK